MLVWNEMSFFWASPAALYCVISKGARIHVILLPPEIKRQLDTFKACLKSDEVVDELIRQAKQKSS